MNNSEVSRQLDECQHELESIQALLTGLGDAAKPASYVKKYAVIRATGSIETSFKKLIADRVDRDSHDQLRNFIERKIRNSSSNPNLSTIVNMLAEFDCGWRQRFNELTALDDKPALELALKDLVGARNSFAHGGTAVLDIEKTIHCFQLGRKVLQILDQILHETTAAEAPQDLQNTEL